MISTKVAILSLSVGLTALVGLGYVSQQYADVRIFSEKYASGRNKNAVAAVVAGKIGQEMHSTSSINLTLEKRMWPDAHITGYTTPDHIETDIDLLFSSVHYNADNTEGHLKGKVNKSEFDWKVEEQPDGTLKISRWGPKWNASLDFSVHDGIIKGKYIRSGPHFDWPITGTYAPDGQVHAKIAVPFGLDVHLEGRVDKN
jgi:hypothetical protein